MADPRKKRLLSRIISAGIPVMMLALLFLYPCLLQREPALTALRFDTAGQVGDGDALLLSGHFDRELPAQETLWLYAENAEIELRAGGWIFRCNGRENAPAMFRSPGSGWYCFDSPGIAAGEPVALTVRSYYGENGRAAEQLLGNLHMGDGSGLYRLMLERIDFFSIVLLFAMIGGFIFMVEGFVDIAMGTRDEGSRVALFGFYCFSGGLWCMTDVVHPYLTLLLSPNWASAMLDMSGLLLFPVALALMMRYYTRGKRTRRVMSVILAVEILTAAVCLLFQLMGVADLIEQQLVIGIAALLSIGTAMGCIAAELWRYRDNYLLLPFLTVLPVFISNTLDGVNIFRPFMPRRFLMRYCFAVSMLLLTFQLVSYARAEYAKAEKLRRLEKELTDSRISIMLSQIQPHFLYNALNTIQFLCRTQPQKAVDVIADFSDYLRGNMDTLADNSLIPFARELRHLENYLCIEQLRFPGIRVVYHLHAGEFLLPALTLQPLVENAIRYGITQREEKTGTVTVSTWEEDAAWYLRVEDDGVGFDPAQAQLSGRSHIGIANTRSRIEAMCGGMLEVESTVDIGTCITITIPKEGALR